MIFVQSQDIIINMNRMDRYISLLFIGYFLAGIIVFVTIFMAVDVMSTMVQYKGVAIESLLKYYAYFTPEVIYKMLPVACLLGMVLTLSNLNRSNELVALFASGLSLLRISAPILILITLISGFGYIASDQALPSMFKNKNYIFYNEIRKKPGMFTMIKEDRIWYRSKNAIFNIKTLNSKQAQAQGLTLYFFDESWDLIEMITAKMVDLSGSHWILRDGSVTLFTNESSFPLTRDFKEKKIVMSEDVKDLQDSGKTSEVLSQKELSQFIAKNSQAGLDTLRYEVDLHSKISFAFTALVMSFLGIPLSVGKARSGGMSLNIGIVIGLVFGYWILYNSFITLGQHGVLPPLVAAWLANIILISLAFWIIKKMKR